MNKLKRIYHIADIHIRNVKRHDEYRQVFYKMFDEIKKRGTEDSIIYLAGDIAHAKLEMSPELLKEISWLFTECSKLCTTILIAGNHDCNMNNADRLDVLTPIVDALKLDNFHYLKDTTIFYYEGCEFGVFSIFDNKDNWPKAEMLSADKKIALFHGPVDNSQTDVGYVVSSRHFTTDIFDGYDLALLGDIHKRQELISPSGCKVVYAGSLVQQNFGETLDKHGFLVWDLDTLTYEEVDIQNDYGYYTLDIDSGIVPDVNDMPLHPRLRVRVTNTDTADTKRMMADITSKYGVEDFTIIRLDSFNKKKSGDREVRIDFDDITESNYQNTLIKEYVERMIPHATKEDLEGLEKINKEINGKIKLDEVNRNIRWKPVRFEFSNMFSYGENNVIKFDKVNGLMGLFAPNAHGKSSLFDSISFCLFDKCSRAYKASSIMNNRKSDFHCQLDFQIDGVDYSIRREGRTINKGKNVKVDVEFWKTEGGEKVSLNGTERRDTNQIIEGYVGRYEDFVMTSLSLQSNNALFIDKSQSERKDLMAQFMGLDVFDKLYEAAADEVKDVNALIRNFRRTDFTTELAQKETDLKTKEETLEELTNKIDGLTFFRDECNKKIAEVNKEIVPVDKKLDINKLTKEKATLENNLIDKNSERDSKIQKLNEYTELLATVSESIQQNKEFQIGEETLGIEIVYKSLQEAKSELEKAEKEHEKVKIKEASLKEKIAHLDEHEYDPNCKFCCDNVFVKDAMKAKEELVELESTLDYTLGEVTGWIQNISILNGVKEQYDSWIDLNSKYSKGKIIVEKTQAELSKLESDISLIQNQIGTNESDIQRYHANEATIIRNGELEREIRELESERGTFEFKLKDTNRDILTLTGQIGSIKNWIQSTTSKMEEVKELENKNELYTFYLDAVKKDGVPYELISKALPAIQAEVNNILAQVVEFSIVMDTDGKNINAKIVYEDQEWALEMCSGMEKFISGLAIRVALINICNLPRPNFLVIDEGFGTLDSDNLASLFMMMQYLKTQFDFIWVISHLDAMRDIVDGLIEIKKVNGFSKINF